MKRLIIILFLLCPFINGEHLHAQLFSTASSRYHSYSNGGTAVAPSYQFHSTSIFGTTIAKKESSSTAPLFVANGTVKTIASSVKGGVLLGNTNDSSEGFIPITQDNSPIIPGVPDTPIEGGWDVALLFAILCVAYAIYIRRKANKQTV